MDSETRQRHMYARNAMICFGVTIACIVIDIKNFISVGHFYFNREMAVSFALYILLVVLGVRALRKLWALKRKSGEES